MRSGWPHAQEDTDPHASRRQAQYGPVDSWPNGYPALGHRDGEFPYPTHGTDPYAAEAPAAALPASPSGEHPYASFGGTGNGGLYTVPDIEAFGYGDPGYSDPGYDGPASADAGIASTQTVRGTVEGYPAEPPYAAPVGQQVDIYHQPWDYEQPLRYDDEDGDQAWPLLEGRDVDTRQQSAAFDPPFDSPGYDRSPRSMPGVAGPGYDLSGIISTGEFPNIGYDQPSYDRLSYDDPRYADFRADDVPRGAARFDLPGLEEPPSDDTQYDLPALNSPRQPAYPSDLSGLSERDSTRFDLPAVDDFDQPWPAREALPSAPGFPGDSLSHDSLSHGSLDYDSPSYDSLDYDSPDHDSLDQTSMDLGGDLPRLNQTRFDMPVVDDFQYGDRFTQTSVDGMRSLAADDADDVEFLSAPAPAVDFGPADTEMRGPGGLVAPVDEPPMNWADETSFDRFGDEPDQSSVTATFTPNLAAFTPHPDSGPIRTGTRRTASGKRRGHSRDRREWMALGAIAVVAAGAIGGVLMKFVFSGPSGPQHTVSSPAKVGGFTREPGLESQMHVGELQSSVIKSSGGKASNVKSGVYQQGASGVGNNPEIFMFVGGNIANSDPQASAADFEQTYKKGHPHIVSAGSLGGEAACATATVMGESVSMCAWFDNDTFADFVSPTMTPAKLAATMVSVRPDLEHVSH